MGIRMYRRACQLLFFHMQIFFFCQLSYQAFTPFPCAKVVEPLLATRITEHYIGPSTATLSSTVIVEELTNSCSSKEAAAGVEADTEADTAAVGSGSVLHEVVLLCK